MSLFTYYGCLLHAMLDLLWCEKDSYADVIGRELLAKMQSNRGR